MIRNFYASLVLDVVILVLLKAKLFYNQGSSVRPKRIAFFVDLGMLKSSYRFQTFHGDSCSSKVRFRKRSNSIIIIRMSVRPF